MTGNTIIDLCFYAIAASITAIIVTGSVAFICNILWTSIVDDYADYKLKREFEAWKDENKK